MQKNSANGFFKSRKAIWKLNDHSSGGQTLLGAGHSGIKVFSASKLHWKAKNYIKGFVFYNLVAIYYTNSKFILNNKTWYIYCIYLYKKGKEERNA